jgi:hypothetical protein
MPLLSLTKQKADELLEAKVKKVLEIDLLNKISAEELWENDLRKLLEVLDVEYFNF